MTTRILHTLSDLMHWCGYLGEQSFPMTVSAVDGEKKARSLSQNATIHLWFGEIATQTNESADQIKRECKYYQGCPILMAEDPDFADFVRNLSHLTTEQKIAAMDYVAVTSVMTTKQLGKMSDAVWRKYAEQGVVLTNPEDRK